MSVWDRLAEIEADAQACMEDRPADPNAVELAMKVPSVLAGLRAVLGRHRRVVRVLEGCDEGTSSFRLSRCAECVHFPGYPCLTVRSIEAALGEGQ